MSNPATLARTRVIAANEALITAGLRHQPRPNTYHHAPYCEQGDRCCCTQVWIYFERNAT